MVPIVNENDTVATNEIRFGDNDRLAALVAHLVGADALVLLSDVDGLYDGDPRTARRAVDLRGRRRRPTWPVSDRAAGGSDLGTGGMASKLTAALLAPAAGVPVLLAAAADVAAALDASARGPGRHGVPPAGPADVGAPVLAAPRRGRARPPRPRRRRDPAVVDQRRSLLAAGIRGVSGDFVAGDVVDLVDPDGTVVARGVVGYDAAELPELIGRSSHELPPTSAARSSTPTTSSPCTPRSPRESRDVPVYEPPTRADGGPARRWRRPGDGVRLPGMGAADRARARLVDGLRDSGRLCSPAVEEAFRTVPRHLFLPGVPLARAYADEAVAVQAVDGVTTSSASQPSMMAIMLGQLDLRPGHRVLEIGAGTGYNAALMARIVGPAGRVVDVDIDADLVDGAARHLAAAGVDGVELVCADGALGYPPGAPYDRIVLTVGSGDVRPEWVAQLAPGGRLLLPLALRGTQLSVALDLGDGRRAAQRLGQPVRVRPAARASGRCPRAAYDRGRGWRCCPADERRVAAETVGWPWRCPVVPGPRRCGSAPGTCGTASGCGSR